MSGSRQEAEERQRIVAVLDLLTKCAVDIVNPFIVTLDHETTVQSFERVSIEGIFNARKFCALLKEMLR